MHFTLGLESSKCHLKILEQHFISHILCHFCGGGGGAADAAAPPPLCGLIRNPQAKAEI